MFTSGPYPPLVLPMMMYGKYKKRVKIVDPKTGEKKYVLKTFQHWEQKGDPGVYPSENMIYVSNRRGGKRLSKMAEDQLIKWRAMAESWALRNGWEMTKNEKVVIWIDTYFPDRRIRDTSNAYKLMMDALQGVIFDNDYYALVRQNDFFIVKKGESPHFKLYIYKKSMENAL